jgi:hypothetical protein
MDIILNSLLDRKQVSLLDYYCRYLVKRILLIISCRTHYEEIFQPNIIFLM